MKLATLFKNITAELCEAGIDDAENDAAILIGHYLGLSRSEIFLKASDEIVVNPELTAAIRRRICREPLAHILESQDFYGRTFTVSKDVLVPRPETELLVEAVVENSPTQGIVLDIGTGSGVIAITLALEIPHISVVGMDISCKALAVARSNATTLNAAVSFLQADMRIMPFGMASVDYIVSNPPYIASAVIDTLQPEVSVREPRLALDGGPRGTDLFADNFGQIDCVLAPGGMIFLEIGADQGDFFAAFFDQNDNYENVKIQKDYAGLDRLVIVCKK